MSGYDQVRAHKRLAANEDAGLIRQSALKDTCDVFIEWVVLSLPLVTESEGDGFSSGMLELGRQRREGCSRQVSGTINRSDGDSHQTLNTRNPRNALPVREGVASTRRNCPDCTGCSAAPTRDDEVPLDPADAKLRASLIKLTGSTGLVQELGRRWFASLNQRVRLMVVARRGRGADG